MNPGRVRTIIRAIVVAAWIVLVALLSWGMTRIVGRTPRA